MKKLLLILSIFLSLSINAQRLTPISFINQPGSADSFWGGYTFAYATSGTPLNGALMSFGGFPSNNYDCQLSSNYFQSQLAFRTRNGDAGLWNPWTNVVTVGAGSAQNRLTKFGSINDLANSIIYDDGTSVGIGTTTPVSKLEVASPSGGILSISTNKMNGTTASPLRPAIDFLGYANGNKARISATEATSNTYSSILSMFVNDGTNATSLVERMTILPNGYVGIGTTTPRSKLDIGVPHAYNQNEVIRIGSHSDANTYWGLGLNYRLDNAGNPSGYLVGYEGSTSFDALSINLYSRRVGIGTSNPDELLTVNGTIHAKEVKVDLTGSLADYVFSPSYKLMPLNQVEQYVKTNSHLPEIPSASEVKEKGMNMGDMQNKLLQKVEELTLYVIEQQKEINQLKQELKK
ncbi:MAG: hypothetical protein PHR83_05165 [Paludibacter sp.]|nr:hypothetical protein [Paludibacter sp.]